MRSIVHLPVPRAAVLAGALLTTLLGCLAGGAPCAAATLEVPGSFPTVQSAIQAASPGDVVRVAPGTYVETLDFLGKAIVVRSSQGPEVTVIDAGGAGSVAVFRTGESIDSVLEGFTLTGGTGTPIGVPTFGGGVLCDNASPVVRGNVVTGNRAHNGGGIACFNGASPDIVDNDIRSNQGVIDDANPFGRGGGVYVSESSAPLVEGNRIEDNFADFRGGGLFCSNSSNPVIRSNRIAGNRTLFEGGGLAVLRTEAPVIERNDVLENTASTRGGGMHVEEAAPVVTGNRFAANASDLHGGGVSLSSLSPARFVRNRFEGNAARGGGGSVYVVNTDAFFAGNVHAFNRAECEVERCGGGGFFCDTGATPRLLSETLHGNTSVLQGGGLFSFALARPVVTNCVFFGNPGDQGQEITVELANLVVRWSLVRGGWPGPGNLAGDPLFVDAASGDFHLRLDSPAVDSGDSTAPDLPALDLDGDPRIVAGTPGGAALVDMGADEMRPEIAARFGSVGDASDGVEAILTVNGSAGDAQRVVRAGVGRSLVVDLAAPSAGPVPAPFVLYLFDGEPDPTTLAPLPLGVGVLGMHGPLDGGRPRKIWNNVGHFPRLGAPDLPSVPAPTRVVDAPAGARFRARVYLQGIVLDDGSAAEVLASATNGVALRIE